MFLSERIKALAPIAAAYYRLVAHFHDGRTKDYPAEPSSSFPVGESPYGVPSGHYAVYFFTEQHRPMPHQNQTIQISFLSEVQRASQSQLSLHQAGTRAAGRPQIGSGPTALPLSSSAALPPAGMLTANPPTPSPSGPEESPDSSEDAGLEFRKYTYAMDREDRQQEFIKNSSYVTEVGEVFALNRIMRRELMELQGMLVLNAQQAHKEVSQVKGTVHDLLELQRAVLSNAAENISRPAPPLPDYVGLGHAALATLRDIGVALVHRSESRPSEPARFNPQLPAPRPTASEEVPDSPSAPQGPYAPAPDAIDKMVSKLRATTDYDIALAMSSPSQWKALLDGLLSTGPEPGVHAAESPKDAVAAQRQALFHEATRCVDAVGVGRAEQTADALRAGIQRPGCQLDRVARAKQRRHKQASRWEQRAQNARTDSARQGATREDAARPVDGRWSPRYTDPHDMANSQKGRGLSRLSRPSLRRGPLIRPGSAVPLRAEVGSPHYRELRTSLLSTHAVRGGQLRTAGHRRPHLHNARGCGENEQSAARRKGYSSRGGRQPRSKWLKSQRMSSSGMLSEARTAIGRDVSVRSRTNRPSTVWQCAHTVPAKASEGSLTRSMPRGHTCPSAPRPLPWSTVASSSFKLDLKSACALLEAGGRRGTGFLVSSDRLMTCHHVVRDASEGRVLVTFSHGQYEGLVEFVAVTNDCAIVRLAKPVPGRDAQPLSIASTSAQKSSSWEGFGFPAANGNAGLLIDGRVQDPRGQDQLLRATVVLQSLNVTAGSRLDGFSGSPVMADGQVIGQMRRIMSDDDGGAQMAVIYACPAEVLASLVRACLGPALHSVATPYRSLASFDVEHAHLYFGREELTQKLVERFSVIMKSGPRLLAILGPSGSGKSSVARAGLVPMLLARQKPPLVAILRPGNNPIDELARTLAALLPASPDQLSAQRKLAVLEVLHHQGPRGEADGLVHMTDDLQASPQRPLVIVVDQFEENYTSATAESRNSFVALLLLAAKDPSPSVAIVLTLRSDFVGETQRHHPELNQLIAAQMELVPALTEAEMRRAIAEPARLAGRPFDTGLVELLLNQARGSEGVLPLLQFALTSLWEGLSEGRAADQVLHDMGGVGGALAGKAQQIYDAVSPREQVTMRRALTRLVRMGEGARDTRRRALIAELAGRGETEADVLAVLRLLATEQARLVTLFSEGQYLQAEVTHEALFEHWRHLRGWIDESRADRRFHDRVTDAAELWLQSERNAGRLWRPPDLELLRKYQQRCPDELSEHMETFLRASLEAQEAEAREKEGFVSRLWAAEKLALQERADKEARERQSQQRLRRFFIGATFLLAVTIIAGLAYGLSEQRRRTRAEAQSSHTLRSQLLTGLIDRGRVLLEHQQPLQAAVLLQEANKAGAVKEHPMLPYLLADAMHSVTAVRSVLDGRPGIFTMARFGPGGNRLLTVKDSYEASVWDAESGKLVCNLGSADPGVVAASFSPDGQRIITAEGGKVARIWEAETCTLLLTLRGHSDELIDVRFSPNGQQALTIATDKTVRLWNSHTGDQEAVLAGTDDASQLLATASYSPDGSRIVTVVHDGSVRIWDARDGKELRKLVAREMGSFARFSPDGRHLLSGHGQRARVWDVETGKLLLELLDHNNLVLDGIFHPDGHSIITWSNYHIEPRIALRFGKILISSGRLFLSGKGSTVYIFSASDGILKAKITKASFDITGLDLSPDGRYIVTPTKDKKAYIWDAQTGEQLALLQGHTDQLSFASYSPDGRRIVTISKDGSARIWNAQPPGHPLLKEAHRSFEHGSIATFSPDGRSIGAVGPGQAPRLWNAESGKPIFGLKDPPGDAVDFNYSLDGRRIVTSGKEQCLRIWNSDTGIIHAMICGIGEGDYTANLDLSGNRVVATDFRWGARVWNVATGTLLFTLDPEKTRIKSATFSPDDQRILTLGADDAVILWDAKNGKMVSVVLEPHDRATLNSANFSPDGSRIVTASQDWSARIWDVASKRCIAILEGHSAEVNSAFFSPDGMRVVTTSADNTARIWDASNGQLLKVIESPSTMIHARFSADGERIVSVEGSGVRIWDVSAEYRTEQNVSNLLGCYVPFRLSDGLLTSARLNPVPCNEQFSRIKEILPWTDRLSTYEAATYAWQRKDVGTARTLLIQARQTLISLDDQESLLKASLAQNIIDGVDLMSAAELNNHLTDVAQVINRRYPSAEENADQLVELGLVALNDYYAPRVALWLFERALAKVPGKQKALQGRLHAHFAAGEFIDVLAQAPAIESSWKDGPSRLEHIFRQWASARLLTTGSSSSDQLKLAQNLLTSYAALESKQSCQLGPTYRALQQLPNPPSELPKILAVLNLLERPKWSWRSEELAELLGVTLRSKPSHR